MVTGCYASVAPGAVGEIDGVDLVVPNDDKDEIVRRLADVGLVPPVAGSEPEPDADAWTHRSERPGWVTLMPALERKARAFVKVQDGCNSHCTYCIVPAARGPQRSRPVQAIVDEVNLLYRLGYREVVLSGVQIGAYGSDWDRETPARAQGAGAQPSPSWPSACWPRRRSRASGSPRSSRRTGRTASWSCWQDPRMCRHLHLPLQSGSDTVLKRMVRRYRAADFRALVERVRGGDAGGRDHGRRDGRVPRRDRGRARREPGVRPRDGVRRAARLPLLAADPARPPRGCRTTSPPPVKKRRSEEARALDAELRRAYKSQFLGRTMDVLWEEPAEQPGPAKD